MTPAGGGRSSRARKILSRVDRRVVVSPAQAGTLLTAAGQLGQRGEHLKAFFAALYYAALRPSEAVMLRDADLHLPKTGRGRVRLRRAHVKRFGMTVDGRVFQTARDGILPDSGYNKVWEQARQEALTPAQYRSPLGRRPYDLRHAAVSLRLSQHHTIGATR